MTGGILFEDMQSVATQMDPWAWHPDREVEAGEGLILCRYASRDAACALIEKRLHVTGLLWSDQLPEFCR